MNQKNKQVNENIRLLELQKMKILDTPAEESFDDIVEMAKDICHVEMAFFYQKIV